MNVSFFQELLTSISESGRALIDRASGGGVAIETIEDLCQALLTSRGEASGVAIAREILKRYSSMSPEERTEFFRFIAKQFGPNTQKVQEAVQQYAERPTEQSLKALTQAVKPPRQELFRRLNLAPGATATIVAMREDILRKIKEHPELGTVDDDLVDQFTSWFNRGFLVLRHIDWDAPASILEKIIAYEAVHEIQGWDDLRRRLEPMDRRCFGFFHPSLVDDPLIFVEVALTEDTPHSIQTLLSQAPKSGDIDTQAPTTAVFYSISNCQKGLRGISFGNFLIKQVVEDLAKEIPSLKTFVTLSPVPGFRRWVEQISKSTDKSVLSDEERAILKKLDDPGWIRDKQVSEEAKPLLMGLAAQYYLIEKRQPSGTALDPVAHFHLRNGACLEHINWLGDTSPKGLKQSYGLMVNYLYDLKLIERNHEAYENEGQIVASKTVRNLLRTQERVPTTLKLIESV